ncbi:MAG: prepilin-type N-terminal cleavage/methylation domain-containing protein [Candidatus Sumerlaeia bacterium]
MRRRAFTLIELMIVVGIIAIMSGTIHAVVVRMMDVHQRFDRRIAVQARGDDAVEAWRKDVALAGSVMVAEGGRGATLEQGGRRIEYAFDGGKLLRREAGAERILAERVVSAAIEPAGGVWRLSFTVEESDGVRKLTQSFAGIGAPLIPAPEVKP